jgi:hypothetical protein|tara:strand:- start:83 stop:805 length:723 start_codon:yes stop_codon:yes gene_type:complete
MSITNRELAQKASAMCLDILSGNVEERKGREAGNMSYFVVEHASGANDQIGVTAYSYKCPMYMLCYREDIGKYEVLVNTTIYSPTTARHMNLFTSELRKVIDPDVVKAYHLDLGSSTGNGVSSRLDLDVVWRSESELYDCMLRVYHAARKGTRLDTLKAALLVSLAETVRLHLLLNHDIPEVDVFSDRGQAIAKAETQKKVLSRLALNTEAEHLKTAINGIRALDENYAAGGHVLSLLRG